MNPILYRNQPIGHVHSDKMQALFTIAPYWGLTFNQNQLSIIPALSTHTVCLKNFDENKRQSLEDLLSHTGIYVTDDEEKCDLVLENFTENSKQSTPITLIAKNIKYYLKFESNVRFDLQRMIHKSVWLPIRESSLAFSFQNLDNDEQIEVLAYNVIQFFMRPQMQPISHISLDVYSNLLDEILTPINPQFALIQKEINKKVWPKPPPELVEEEQDDANKERPSIEQKSDADAFNPFKNHSPLKRKKINPFQENKKNTSSQINPFK